MQSKIEGTAHACAIASQLELTNVIQHVHYYTYTSMQGELIEANVIGSSFLTTLDRLAFEVLPEMATRSSENNNIGMNVTPTYLSHNIFDTQLLERG